MICIVGPSGAIEAANPAFCTRLGVEPDELLAKPFLDLVHPEDREKTRSGYDALSEGRRVLFVSRMRSKDGSYLPVEWRCDLSKESGARYFMGTDVTDQTGLASALKESRDTAVALFENAAQGILTVDETGRILSFNPMAEKLFGYEREEIVGRSLESLMPGKFSEIHARHRKDYFGAPRTRPMGLGMDLLARRNDGTEFPVEISLSHIRSRGRTVAVAFINDISERKRSESERVKLEQRLEHATKMEAVGRLAGGIAHDFNNLLTALSGFAEIVLDELPETHPLYQGAQETFKMCQRSTTLVRRLLAVSRRQVQQLEVMELNPKIAEIEKLLRNLLGEDVELLVKLHPAAGLVRADQSQIEQVVLNLVVNARDAMPRGGRLVIQTANVDIDDSMEDQHIGIKPGSYVVLSVSDTGTGMDQETLQHIFEPFFTTKERGKGTGLGLATVYGIVNQSGGHIWAYSEVGKGATFKIYLPRIQPERTLGLTPATAVPASRGSETILVVEDETPVRFVAVGSLRKAGYRVLEARDAEEALRVASSHEGAIHLVLTDVLMPRMHGPELVKRLSERRPKLRSLFMSGHADDALFHHGVLHEGIAFLEKPFTREELARKVREVLEAT
jgi:PAS domain S-box-containing protein